MNFLRASESRVFSFSTGIILNKASPSTLTLRLKNSLSKISAKILEKIRVRFRIDVGFIPSGFWGMCNNGYNCIHYDKSGE